MRNKACLMAWLRRERRDGQTETDDNVMCIGGGGGGRKERDT